MKAYGPGLKASGVIVNKPTEFTIDARMAGKGHLKIYAQVLCQTFILYLEEHLIHLAYGSRSDKPFFPLSFSPPPPPPPPPLASPAQDAEGCTIDIKITDKGDGTFHCVYTPVKPIKHTIIITWGEVNVPNSPFRVRHWQLLPAALFITISEFSAALTLRGMEAAGYPRRFVAFGLKCAACVLIRCWLARALTQTESRSTGLEWRKRD